jgi:hypothetical protein
LRAFGNGPAVLPLEAPLVGPGRLVSAGCALMCAFRAGAAVGALPRLDAGQIRQETEERSQARLGVLRLIGNDSACCLQIMPGQMDRFAGRKGKQGKQGQPTKGKPHHDLPIQLCPPNAVRPQKFPK